MPKEKLRVALFGAGKMGLHHIRAVQIQNCADIVAVADPNIDREKIAHVLPKEVKIFSKAETLLKSVRPDVVHIVTPPQTHIDLARLALNYGANIYVEKPFSLNTADAKSIISLAEKKGLKICAAHQVLFQDTGRKYQEYLSEIGDVVHVESYFSFKKVRRAADGKSIISPIEQLLDILPHPVYLLLSALENNQVENSRESLLIKSMEVDPDGNIHAIIKKGMATGILIVTLRGRPIESYLRIVGTNGSIYADFVLSGVTKLVGPGESAISLVLTPYSQARQILFGTTATIAKMIFKRQKSYAGLVELIGAFYDSLLKKTPVPITSESIINTVEICENVGNRLDKAQKKAEQKAMLALEEAERKLGVLDSSKGTVLITGGTGFLGRVIASELRSNDWRVRVIARRIPSAEERIPGVEYLEADIADPIPGEYFNHVSIILHLAAETIGGKDAHDRNTVRATRNMMGAAKDNGINKFINISSIAVLKPSKSGIPLNEKSDVDLNNLGRGPYVWGKAEAEKIAIELGNKYEIDCKTIRLGPLVDFDKFNPPGRLGREVGPLYIAVGSKRSKLSLCDVHTASNVIHFYVQNYDAAPALLNLVEPDPPTRAELISRLRARRADLRIVWMPDIILKLLSVVLKTILKMLKPSKKPLDLYAAFASEKYDSELAASVVKKAR